LLQRGLPTNFDQANKYAADRKRIQQWLTSSLLKRVFGGQPDNVLRPIRDVLRGKKEVFPFEEIRGKFKGTTRALTFTGDDIESLLDSKYGQAYAFSVLVLLYPTLDFRNSFHVDHIYPRSHFTRPLLTKRGITGEDSDFYFDSVNLLPNLQLLEGIPNQEKNDSDFEEWLKDIYKRKPARRAFMEKNYIPDDLDLGFDNFREVFTQRRAKLAGQLMELLRPDAD
jgi:hypothetical protein